MPRLAHVNSELLYARLWRKWDPKMEPKYEIEARFCIQEKKTKKQKIKIKLW